MLSSEDRIMVSPSCVPSDSLADNTGEKHLRGVTAGLGMFGDGVVRRLLTGDGVHDE